MEDSKMTQDAKNDHVLPQPDGDTEAAPATSERDDPSHDFENKSVRKEFISKVFMMVLLQMLVIILVSWQMYDLEKYSFLMSKEALYTSAINRVAFFNK